MDLVQVDVLEPPELVHQHPKHLASSVLVWPELVQKHPKQLALSVLVCFV